MPRIAGLNIVAVLAGAVAYYLVGMIIYGFTLTEVWGNEMLKNHGLAAQDAAPLAGEALMAELNKIPNAMSEGMAYGLGFLVALVTTIGIAFVLNKARPASLVGALGVALLLWLCFAATGLAYNVLYSSESRVIFGIDLMHLAIAFLLSAGVMYLIDGKAISAKA